MNKPAASDQKVLLSVRNLTIQVPVGNGTCNLVDDVSFDIMESEVFALVGESGSGKSLTMMAVLGLLPLPLRMTQGTIVLRGQELTELDFNGMRQVRGKKMAIVFQDPMTALNPVIRVGKQVDEAIRLHNPGLSAKQIRARGIELFRQVGIPNPEQRYDQFPNEFSGGMRQRVVIAIAMANEPDLLIADEPTTALDVTIQAQVMDVLREVRERTGAAMILISHDLGLVAEHADRIGVLYSGSLVETGTTEQVFGAPQHPYTAGLIASLPRVDQKVDRLYSIPGFVPAPDKRPKGCAFSTRCEMSRDRDACTHARPTLRSMPEGRHSACHYAEETESWAKAQAAARVVLDEVDDSALRQAAEPILSVQDLQKEFDVSRGFLGRRAKMKALRGISFDILKGRTLGLVGESGCGKSTLARVLLRLMEASGGQVMLNGKPLLTMQGSALRSARRNLQVVFQDPYSSLDPRMTVHDIIAEPMRIHDCYDAARVNELLAHVGLGPEALLRRPGQFSGGQRQRIAIARALALQPDVLILDEAVSALDVSIQAQVINLLRDLQAEFGLTYVFISHDLSVVRHISDDVAVMYLGRIIEYGSVREVFENPEHPYTQALLSAIPRHHVPEAERGERILLAGDLPNPLSPPSGCAFRSRCRHAVASCAQSEPELIERTRPHHQSACLRAEELSNPAKLAS
ncbi:ABC transporter ATP-binding protein [Phaeovulum sp. NW3]|uniref:ABC transporter ATP-binding protein n=1 Tax=Phaeovulum sp. NW3 TaxID=2934933 RepID=UPI0020216601|nr:ABC transporter ATP-binding protein [Phaeovulum sp. NW3]MCL7466271.1 ABC transporter ATP-binding protein [Phaeovulum sp. NW3]